MSCSACAAWAVRAISPMTCLARRYTSSPSRLLAAAEIWTSSSKAARGCRKLLGASTAASCNPASPLMACSCPSACIHPSTPGAAPQSQPVPWGTELLLPRGAARAEGGTVPTFQLSHGGISQAGLAERRRRLLALPSARGVLAARQRVPHVGVGDQDGQAGIGQRDQDGLQGPAARAHWGPCAHRPCLLRPSAIRVRPRGRQLLPPQRQSLHGLGFHSSISLPIISPTNDLSDFVGQTAQASSRKDAGGEMKTQELKRREPQLRPRPPPEILGWVQG